MPNDFVEWLDHLRTHGTPELKRKKVPVPMNARSLADELTAAGERVTERAVSGWLSGGGLPDRDHMLMLERFFFGPDEASDDRKSFRDAWRRGKAERRRSRVRAGREDHPRRHVATIELVLPLAHRNERVLGRIQGFWEIYHYSVSEKERLAISLSLLYVTEINRDGLIRYETYDHLEDDGGLPPDERTEPQSRGWCFEAPGFLYFVCQDLYDELKLYIVHYSDSMRAQRAQNVLWGMLLCTNGIDFSEDPAATKVAFRWLGLTAQDAAAKSVVDIPAVGDDAREAESQLKKYVGGYLDDRKPLRLDIYKVIKESILPHIRNEISATVPPMALVMRRPKGKKRPRK